MIIILSPSKSIDFSAQTRQVKSTEAGFLNKAAGIIQQLTGYKIEEILQKERLSPKMALSTYEYFQTFSLPQAPQKPAFFAFSGNVYDKLNVATLSDPELDFAQQHVRIFSALYGILRPMDLIKPYRLDMLSKLISGLYNTWQEDVSKEISTLLSKDDKTLINLASAEYFKILKQKQCPSGTRIITPVFQQEKNGKFVTSSLYAKQARGLMLRFIIKNAISDPEYIKAFDDEGYFFNPHLSKGHNWHFTRIS